MTAILGISAFYHDSAACLVIDGKILAAAQEERFSRRKHDHRMPVEACRYCLREAGLTARDLDYVAFYDKPILKFDRLLETYADFAPRGYRSFVRTLRLWLKERLWMPGLIRSELARVDGIEDERQARRAAKEFSWPLLFGDHHESHAASAFYPSPFKEAAVLTVDGVGEWATAAVGVGRDHDLELLKTLPFPHSLGLLYSAFTYYLGFKVNGGEYKIMGLAPYGEPKYVDLIKKNLVHINDDGSLRVNQQHFDYCTGSRMTNKAFHALFGGPPRKPESPLDQKSCDLARSIQAVTEEAMLKMAHYTHRETGMKRLCLAGGVALNCVANARILAEGPFEEVWIQPAAGDAGAALGVAMAVWHRYLAKPRASTEENGTGSSYADPMRGALLGPAASESEIRDFLHSHALPFTEYRRDQIPEAVAGHLATNKVVGLHQGRMEFGPRALGARSILADPRSPHMASLVNRTVKYREDFRPFAPSVLLEYAAEWFQHPAESPYMLLVADVANDKRTELSVADQNRRGLDRLDVARSEVPAVTHIDYSSRLQTVRRELNPMYWEIIEAFRRRTGCPLLLNTSLNVRGEPISCSVEDSYRCFMRSGLDVLVLETFVLEKEALRDHELAPD